MIATTIPHKTFAAFTKVGKGQLKAHVIGKDGDFVIAFGNSEDYALIHLGECDQNFRFVVDFRQVADFVRLSGAKSNIEVNVDGNTLILNSDKVGEFKIEGNADAYVMDYVPFGNFCSEIGADQSSKALPAVRYCDHETGRFALSCVKFEDGFAAATDGRRLIRIAVGDTPELLVPSWMVELSAATKSPIQQFDGGLAVGNVLIHKSFGRFPMWQRVINTTDCRLSVDVKELLERSSKSVNLWKLDDEADIYPKVVIDTDHGSITLNAKFVVELLKSKKCKAIEFRYASNDFKRGILQTPAHFLTEDVLEVVMPISA